MIAVVTIREEPCYRRQAFVAGLRRVGYAVVDRANPDGPEDYLILWNYHPATIGQAAKWEAQGGTVIVCENGYAGKDELGRQYYAIAVHGHNGSGWFPVGAEDRFGKLAIEVHPWRRSGEYVLVCGQRGVGSPAMASPGNWHQDAARRIAGRTAKMIKVRTHPGRHEPQVPLDADLAGAHACLIWSSAAGVRSLSMGVPVVYDAPGWICAGAATKLSDWIESGRMIENDELRARALHQMAWGQRSVAELESGEPFATIRERIGEAKW